METLQRTANRGSISTGFDIDNSLKFEADNREYLRWTNFSTYASSARKKKFSMSVWVKRTEIGVQQVIWSTAANGYLSFEAADNIKWQQTYSGVQKTLNTNRVFRDTSAWYHIVLQVDTAQSTEADRTKLYINGVQETSFSSATYPSQNDEAQNLYEQHLILGEWGGGSVGFSGYVAEHYFLSEVALVPGDVGETDEDSGIWKPKAYGGTISSPSYFLEFQDSSDLGTATSGLDADTMNNISSADQATDTPTNNFCTLNQLALDGSVGSSGNITQGATKATATEFDVFITFAPTFGVTSGKWYAEFEYEGSQADNLVGILDIDAVVAYNSRLGKAGQWSVGFYQANGTLYVTSDSGVTSTASWGASATNGDIISVAVDMDNHFVYFAKNGTYQNSGVPTSGSTGTGGVAFDSNKTVGIGCSSYDQGGDEGQIFANYGGFTAGTISSGASDGNGYGTFEYAPPSGYYALCTKNLAEEG